mmetsp:Transcript_28418/g.57714  ORF Transcript_28418/g.57714 Transcript_28418/m.57714 type:complete len:143 (+) Transcript_28418:863-1291(+)
MLGIGGMSSKMIVRATGTGAGGLGGLGAGEAQMGELSAEVRTKMLFAAMVSSSDQLESGEKYDGEGLQDLDSKYSPRCSSSSPGVTLRKFQALITVVVGESMEKGLRGIWIDRRVMIVKDESFGFATAVHKRKREQGTSGVD